MKTVEFDKPPEELVKVALAAFPDYRGRKFRFRNQESVDVTDGNYWDEGSRNYYAFVSLNNLAVLPMETMHPHFDPKVKGAKYVILPKNVVCVKHTIFCGKDLGLTVIAGLENKPAFLPEPETLTWEEQVVLVATRSLKNTYGGRTNIRMTEAMQDTGITKEAYITARDNLVEKGFLRKNLSITAKGNNAVGSRSLFHLRRKDVPLS